MAIIMYWLANNIWTFGQQHYVFGKIEKEEEQKKQEALERRAANAPAPGAKPSRKKKPATDTGADAAGTGSEVTSPSEGVELGGPANDISAQPDSPAGAQDSNKPAARNGAVSRTPKPGARPRKRKR
jgi:YidC/Oxa1 family membrane protein insertase